MSSGGGRGEEGEEGEEGKGSSSSPERVRKGGRLEQAGCYIKWKGPQIRSINGRISDLLDHLHQTIYIHGHQEVFLPGYSSLRNYPWASENNK